MYNDVDEQEQKSDVDEELTVYGKAKMYILY